MSVAIQIIFPALFAGVLIRAIGILIALRLGRLTRGTIETPSEWNIMSSQGHKQSMAWLKMLSESAHTDWSRKARLALRLERSGMFLFFAGWLVAILAIVFG